jgi:hypothetical protein
MATEQLPGSAPAPVASQQIQPLQAWLARLGLSGKLLAIGGLVGLIAVFLPLLSVSMQMNTTDLSKAFGGKGVNVPAINIPSVSRSVMVIGDWRGTLCFLGYLGVGALAFLLYPANGLRQKGLAWAGVGVGAFLALFALWLVILALNGSAGMASFGGSLQISMGIGAILNFLAAAAVAAGGFLKAREEKLI